MNLEYMLSAILDIEEKHRLRDEKGAHYPTTQGAVGSCIEGQMRHDTQHGARDIQQSMRHAGQIKILARYPE